MAYIRKIKVNGENYDIADNTRIKQQIILATNQWSNNTITVSCEGVTSQNDVIISPTATSFKAYGAYGIICISQGTDTLTFTCDTSPSEDINLNILIFN